MKIIIKDIGVEDYLHISCEDKEKLNNFYGLTFNNNNMSWMISVESALEISNFFKFDDVIFDDLSIKKMNQLKSARQTLIDLKNEKIDISSYKQNCKNKTNKDFHLDDYQLYSAIQMALSKRNILALPVGKGKTLSSIEALSILRDKKAARNTIIFTKSVCVEQIKDEILNNYDGFYVESIPDVNSKKRLEKYLSFSKITKPKILVTNYEKVLNDSESIKRCKFDSAILDEVSVMKGASDLRKKPKSARTCGKNIRYEIFHITKDMEYVWGLSATPIENNILELHNVYAIVKPDLFPGGLFRFRECFASVNYWGAVDGVKNEYILNRIIEPYLITKKFKSESQNKIEVEEVLLDFNKEDSEKYELLLSSVKKEIDNIKEKYEIEVFKSAIKSLEQKLEALDDNEQRVRILAEIKKIEATKKSFEQKSRYEIMAQISKLRKFCDFPNMVFDDFPIKSTKMDWVIKKLKEIPKEDKVLIFAEHVEVINRIDHILTENGFKFVKIIGETKMKERDVKLDFTKNDEDCNIIISTDCLAYGKNIQFANRMILYSLPYNPAKSKQRVGRIDRRGQEKDITIYVPLIKQGYDYKAYKKIQGKIRTTSSIVGFDMKISLNTSEFVQLLKN